MIHVDNMKLIVVGKLLFIDEWQNEAEVQIIIYNYLDPISQEVNSPIL